MKKGEIDINHLPTNQSQRQQGKFSFLSSNLSPSSQDYQDSTIKFTEDKSCHVDLPGGGLAEVLHHKMGKVPDKKNNFTFNVTQKITLPIFYADEMERGSYFFLLIKT